MNTDDFIVEYGMLTQYLGSGGDVVIPEEVSDIENDVFSGNKSLKSVSFQNRTKHIFLYETFANCDSLEYADLPDECEVSSFSFYNCRNLCKVRMPVVMNYDVGQYCFYCCESLEQIQLPDVERINKGAFRGCMILREIHFPSTLKAIDYRSFSDCKSLIEYSPFPLNVADREKSLYRDVNRMERLERGFCEEDWANIGDFLISLLAEILTEFSNLHHGVPMRMIEEDCDEEEYDNVRGNAKKEWDNVLEKMAEHFRHAQDWRRMDLPDDIPASVIQQSSEKPQLNGALEALPSDLLEAYREGRLPEANDINALFNLAADGAMRMGFDMLKEYIWNLWD